MLPPTSAHVTLSSQVTDLKKGIVYFLYTAERACMLLDDYTLSYLYALHYSAHRSVFLEVEIIIGGHFGYSVSGHANQWGVILTAIRLACYSLTIM